MRGRRMRASAGAATTLVVLGLATAAWGDGRSGSLDTRYGAGRTGVVPLEPVRNALVSRSGDVLLLGNDNALRRLTPSGRADVTFGADGAAPLPGLPLADIHAVRLANGGALYAAASAGAFPPAAIVVTKVRASGAPDMSFGGDGSVDYPPTSFAFNEIRAAATTADGRAFVVGNEDSGDGTVRRIEADGGLLPAGRCAGVPAVQSYPGDHYEAAAAHGNRVVIAGFGIDLATFNK